MTRMEESSSSLRPLSGTRALVTGGTGFTGTHLVRKLAAAGAEVRCIARQSSIIGEELGETATWYRGDVHDPDIVAEAMAGVNYVFHLASCFRDGGAEEMVHRDVHVESTKLLAKAAMRQPQFERFVHTSTVGVHGHIEDPPADEAAPFNPGDVYQRTKLEGELWVREFADQARLPLTVVRPAAIIGPDDRRLLKLFKFAKYGICPLLDGHDPSYHLIHVEDLTRCMRLCAHHPEAVGEVFICGNPEPTSLVDILTEVGDVIDRKVRFIPVPSRPVFMLADANEWIADRLSVEPLLYRRRVAFFTKDRAFDPAKLQDVLDFDYRYDNVTGIRETARGYLESGWM